MHPCCQASSAFLFQMSCRLKCFSLCQVMGADFGRSIGTLVGNELPLAVATPLDACTALTNPSTFAGRVVLLQKGNCTFETKVCDASLFSPLATACMPAHKSLLCTISGLMEVACHRES